MKDEETEDVNASDLHAIVMCRCCHGIGKHSPEYDSAITLIQSAFDAGGIQALIDHAMARMQIKHSKRQHVRKLIEQFCDLANKFNGI